MGPSQYSERKAVVCVAGRKKVSEWSSGNKESIYAAEHKETEKFLGM